MKIFMQEKSFDAICFKVEIGNGYDVASRWTAMFKITKCVSVDSQLKYRSDRPV